MDNEIIDLEEVLERVENDRELLIELIEIFLEDYPNKITELKNSVANKNGENTQNIAHSLKGASANISAKKISSIFLGIENSVKDNNFAAVEQVLGQLEGLIEDLKKFLVKLKENLSNS